MENLIEYLQSRITLNLKDINFIKKYLVAENVPPQTTLLKAGQVERYIYFLDTGIVKGYQNVDGKIVIQHLVDEKNFFTSIDSFFNETPSLDYFETIKNCNILKISKLDLDLIRTNSSKWNSIIETITNEHLNLKIERVKDFQMLTAKERYIKFIKESPNLSLNVSIENIASYLGIEPQSLSRIRREITF